MEKVYRSTSPAGTKKRPHFWGRKTAPKTGSENVTNSCNQYPLLRFRRGRVHFPTPFLGPFSDPKNGAVFCARRARFWVAVPTGCPQPLSPKSPAIQAPRQAVFVVARIGALGVRKAVISLLPTAYQHYQRLSFSTRTHCGSHRFFKTQTFSGLRVPLPPVTPHCIDLSIRAAHSTLAASCDWPSPFSSAAWMYVMGIRVYNVTGGSVCSRVCAGVCCTYNTCETILTPTFRGGSLVPKMRAVFRHRFWGRFLSRECWVSVTKVCCVWEVFRGRLLQNNSDVNLQPIYT